MAGGADPPAVGAQLQGVTTGGRSCSTFAHCVELLSAGELIDYDGASGRIAFDAAGDISSARVTTSRVIDGVLQPTSVQDVDLIAQQEEAIFAASVFVTQLQQALKVLGYFDGDITGVYDEATTAAVAALQRDLGLPDTGQFDEATDAAMRERLGVGVSTFGTSVSQLQQALADRGFYTGPIDGRYSAATIEAVRAFQRDLGVPETGVIDVATLQAIYARGQETGAATVPTVPPETYPPPPPPTAAPTTTAPKPPPTAAPTPPPTAAPEPEPVDHDDGEAHHHDRGASVADAVGGARGRPRRKVHEARGDRQGRRLRPRPGPARAADALRADERRDRRCDLRRAHLEPGRRRRARCATSPSRAV